MISLSSLLHLVEGRDLSRGQHLVSLNRSSLNLNGRVGALLNNLEGVELDVILDGLGGGIPAKQLLGIEHNIPVVHLRRGERVTLGSLTNLGLRKGGILDNVERPVLHVGLDSGVIKLTSNQSLGVENGVGAGVRNGLKGVNLLVLEAVRGPEVTREHQGLGTSAVHGDHRGAQYEDQGGGGQQE